VRVSEDPLTAVARGTGVFLEKIRDLKIALDAGDD
jgi:actin-like ATPase involved in cell morphogenesis